MVAASTDLLGPMRSKQQDWPVSFDELAETPDGTSPVPDEQITKSQFRILRSLVYGIDTYRDLFNDRQLLILGLLSEATWGGVCGDAV